MTPTRTPRPRQRPPAARAREQAGQAGHAARSDPPRDSPDADGDAGAQHVRGDVLDCPGHLAMTLMSWTRLEPRARDNGLEQGLQARVADPLWLLARQRTFGEFTGEDAG